MDKVAIVTGSSYGIGKAIALEFLKSGAKVILNGRDDEILLKTIEEFQLLGFYPEKFTGDISSYAACEQLIRFTVEKYERIDILINNVGLGFRGKFEETEPWVFEKVISSNLLSSIHCTRAGINEIKKTRGSVVFISSIAGIRGLPMNSAYCIAKMGLTALAQALRIELHTAGIHVGYIQVGLTDYDENKRIVTSSGSLVHLCRKSHQSRGEVAKIVLNTIKKRKHFVILTFLGKLTYLLQRISPKLVELIIRNSKQTTALYTR